MSASIPSAAAPGVSRGRLHMPLVALLCAAASLWRGMQAPLNDDDVYHLHSIWLVAHGHVPYRGFFEIHLPGMWIVLAPLAWLVHSGSGLLLAGRTLVAILFGASVLLGGRIVGARGAQAVLLGLASLLALGACQFWLFRAEYVAAFLVLAHLWLLSRDGEEGLTGRHAFLAAATLALACTMSVRPMVFLLVQPALLLADWVRRRALPPVGHSLAGLLAGALPAGIVLAVHGLWRDAFYWSFRFVSSGAVVEWQSRIDVRRAPFFLAGAACVVLLQFERRLPSPTRLLLGLAWLLAFAFDLVNPLKMPFARIHLLLLTAVLASQALFTLAELISSRVTPAWRAPVRAAFPAIAILAVLGLNLHYRSVPRTFHAQTLRAQLGVLDWLQGVSGGEPVVLVAPYHPMVVPDATDLQNAWHYCYWIEGEPVRRRLQGFSEAVLRQRPPVIAGDPWLNHTRDLKLLDWLQANDVDSPAQLDAVRRRLAEQYVEVRIPDLGSLHFGTAFWVRRDRFAGSRLPADAVIQKN